MPLDWDKLLAPVEEERKIEADGSELIFFKVDAFWKSQLSEHYSGPCMVCHKDPRVGDIWCVILVGTKRRAGHKECLNV